MSLESHAHRLAKSLMVGWLRDAAAAAGRDEIARFGSLSWRVNRGAPTWGVWEELPVLSDLTGIAPVWDEFDKRWRHSPPSYSDLLAMRLHPITVLDIGVQHKGRIAFAVEIVHKHPCDALKLLTLRRELSVIEIPAYWVLGQVGVPSDIPAEFWL